MAKADKPKSISRPMFLNRKRALSSVMAINNLIGGYLSKTPTGIFGSPEAGKSIMWGVQEPFFIAKQIDKGILYIDTEGGGDLMWEEWYPVFADRFDFEPKVVFQDLREVEDILFYHGFNIDTKESSKGKVDIVYTGKGNARIEKDIKAKDIGILVYDSLTRPIEVPGGRVNFAARSDLINMWMGAMHKLAIENDLFVFATHHATQDPARPYIRPAIKGGKNVLHNFKIHFYLNQRSFSSHRDVRDIYLTRYPSQKGWKGQEQVIYTDKGVFDITPEELAKLGKKAKEEEPEVTETLGD